MLTRERPGGAVLRRLLPAAVAVLMVLGLMAWEGERHGLYESRSGLRLLTAAAIAVIGGLLWYFAGWLDRVDAKRRDVEDELRRTSRHFKLSQDLVCTAGFDGVFKQLNSAWTETLGWSEAELRSRPFVEFVHPDDRERTEQETAGLAQGGVTVDFVNRYATKDGGWRWIDWKAMAIVEEGLIYASARDVTQRKAVEGALEASERQTRQILETAHDAFISIDASGLITDWNPQAQASFGWGRQEVLGRELAATVIPERHREAHRRGIEHFLATGEAPVLGERLELTAVHRDGREFPVELTISALETDDGHSFHAFVRDISERRRAQEELALARDRAVAITRALEAGRDELLEARSQADRANRAKSQFLSRMSHELRTPLNAILGFAQLLELDSLPEPQGDSVKHIVKGGRHLLTLIDEVLDISRIEAGELTLSLEPVPVAQTVREALALVAPLAATREVRLGVTIGNLEDSAHVRADVQRLKQVLLNLLSNAIKYNRSGGRVDLSFATGDGRRLRILVADTGVGIAREQLAGLFEPFDRLGAEFTEVEGTGLGLSLAKRMVEAMGGSIAVESEPGQGTTFTIELDAAAPSDHGRDARIGPAAPHQSANGLAPGRHRLLYIEDNISNLTLVERLLDRQPTVELVPAMLGGLGLELARQDQPGLILLDLHLPDMSGEEVLRRLKADDATREIPVVVLSADASTRQAERLLRLGALEYLTKPLDIKHLLEVIAANLHNEAAVGR